MQSDVMQLAESLAMVQRDKKQSITNCTTQLQSLVIQMQTCSKCKLAMERCQWTTRTTVVRSKVDVTQCCFRKKNKGWGYNCVGAYHSRILRMAKCIATKD